MRPTRLGRQGTNDGTETVPRIIKHPSIRKAEFVEAARALFFERGYDRTSVDVIIARAGVSKGAFYYYFPSKEAVLEAVAEQMADATLAEVRDIIEDDALGAFERLDTFLKRARQLKVAEAPEILTAFEVMFRPENVLLYHRVHMAVSRVVAPVVAAIVALGVKEGTFRSNDPAVTAEILLRLMTTTHDVVAGLFAAQTEEAFRRAAAAFEHRWIEQGIAVDRILGLPDGSVQLVEPGYADAIFAGWRARRSASA